MRRAGIYVIRGTKGTRVGQSTNVHRRIPEVLKQYRKCVGQPRRIEFYPAQGSQIGDVLRNVLFKRYVHRAIFGMTSGEFNVD